MERERPLEERRRASDLSRTVERHRQAKCCQSNGLTFYCDGRDGVLLTHDGRVFTITSRLKQPHLKASCRYRGDCAQSPPGECHVELPSPQFFMPPSTIGLASPSGARAFA